MVALCNEKKGGFISSSNFSLGVNIFFELNEYLAKIMSQFDSYKVTMEEIHHTQKLDAPSGTAISLAKGVIENSNYARLDFRRMLKTMKFILKQKELEMFLEHIQ